MRKSLFVPVITILLAVPGVSPAAIDLYGAAHLSLDVVNNSDRDPDNRKTAVSVTSNHSHLGLRGRELLRDNFAVRWQIETIVDLDDGGWGEGRDSFVALETRIGSFLLGRHASPYRALTERFDVFHETRGDASAVLGTVDGDPVFHRRASNLIQFASPEALRLQLTAAYIANQQDDNLPQSDALADLSGYGAALRFASGPLFAGFGYERLGVTETPTQFDAKATRFVLGWDFGQGTRTTLVRERAGNGNVSAGGEQRREAWYANLSHVSGNLTWKLAYGLIDDLVSTPDSGAHFFAAGVSWAASPRVEIYGLATGMINDDNAQYGLQPWHDETSRPLGDDGVWGGVAAAGPGRNVSAVSGGVIYRFDIGL